MNVCIRFSLWLVFGFRLLFWQPIPGYLAAIVLFAYPVMIPAGLAVNGPDGDSCHNGYG